MSGGKWLVAGGGWWWLVAGSGWWWLVAGGGWWLWREHSCLPRLQSCGRLAGRRHDCRRGTQECVRHNGTTDL